MNETYLRETFYFDYSNPLIQDLISDLQHIPSERQKISSLYLKVRDGWRYNPYNIGLLDRHYTASFIASKTQAHCVDKAILYIAGLRGLGIPARLRLAKVSNHIAVERLEQKLGTNEIAPHGLVEVFFKDQWVKCSPAFNKELCQMYKVSPLAFDGSQDAILQEYNNEDLKFMEYLEDYGSFEDVPLEYIKAIFKENYPELYKTYKEKDLKI